MKVSSDVLEKFDGLNVAVMMAKGDGGRLLDRIGLRQRNLESIQASLEAVDPITSHSSIATWRKIYGEMGLKPSKYRSSIESLLRRVQKGNLLELGIEVVDLYNLVSVHNSTPMGAYDMRRLSAEPLELRFCDTRRDRFDPLGSSSENYPLLENLVVYAQGNEVLCWGFNSRDSKVSAVEKDSKEIVFFAESFGDDGLGSAAALSDLQADLRSADWQVSDVHILNKVKSEIEVGV
jgi:lysyl-tRNA synthetase class 2